MADGARLDPAAVAVAVRALLQKETARVDDPRPVPEDRAGWHALRPVGPETAGAPYYRPESWRWFELVDVALVDEMVLVVFRWTDPATPELRYSYLAHADGLRDEAAAALVVRGQLRRLLEPGWRDRVLKRWLSRSQVLVWRDPADGGRPRPVRDRRAALREEIEDASWSADRGAEPR